MKKKVLILAACVTALALAACSKPAATEPEATPTVAVEATATPVPTKAPAAPSELTVDLSGRLSVWGQGTGTENADGSVTIPEALRAFMGVDKIEKK